MEKRFMRKNKWQLCPLILLASILFNSACGQNPPLTGKAYITEEKLAEQTTILLNNAGSLIPLQNLGQLKI
ncbi:MAG: beta-N-acetylglucosaminidase, partial [Mucilaginibacter sp.]|nr:beta-N-acetylglucosaminidase [Mucilaginibacter sp.]